MFSLRRPHTLFLLLLALLSGLPRAAIAERGVVWLTAHSEGENEEAWVRIPLEWIANVDQKEHSEIQFDGETIDCTELWLAHKDLPAGETREVGRGTTDDGERYVAQVVSEKPSSRRAVGKVHILAQSREGESTDIRFPLDLTAVLQQLGGLVRSFFGAGSVDRSTLQGSGFHADKLGELKRLADYGPFVFLQSSESDGSKVKISIE